MNCKSYCVPRYLGAIQQACRAGKQPLVTVCMVDLLPPLARWWPMTGAVGADASATLNLKIVGVSVDRPMRMIFRDSPCRPKIAQRSSHLTNRVTVISAAEEDKRRGEGRQGGQESSSLPFLGHGRNIDTMVSGRIAHE